MYKVMGLCNLHHSPDLGELTASRPLASTSFLGRYAFIGAGAVIEFPVAAEGLGERALDRTIELHAGFGFEIVVESDDTKQHGSDAAPLEEMCEGEFHKGGG